MQFRVATVLAVFAGLGFIAYSATLPRFSDPDWERPFLVDVSELDRSELSRQWHDARQESLTSRGTFEDLGLGLLALVASAWAMLAMFGTGSGNGYPGLATPGSFMRWLLLGIIGTALLAAGFVADLALGYVRLEFPWWADSVAIPLMAVPVELAAGGLISVVVALGASRLSDSPLKIVLSDRPRVLATLLAVPLLPIAALLLVSVPTAPTYVPACAVALYAAFSLRQVVLGARTRSNKGLQLTPAS